MARTVGLTCLVLGSALLAACVTLYFRKQKRKKGRHDGAGGVGEEGDTNSNQI
jgi:hypothetical protein